MMKGFTKAILATFVCGIFCVNISPGYAALSVEEIPGDIVAGQNDISNFVHDSFEAATLGVKVVFPYNENSVYKVYCQEGFLTDIAFATGEQIIFIGGGDTSRWSVEKSSVGAGLSQVDHVYIKPLQRGISTNIIINTNKRSYQLTVVSASFYNPSVAWIVEAQAKAITEKRIIKNYLTMEAEKLNFNYKFKKKDWAWCPVRVFDDGKKTYLLMKPEIFAHEAPAFFVLNRKDEIVLVNYRILNGYYIVDRLFDRAVLQVGRDKIEIRRAD